MAPRHTDEPEVQLRRDGHGLVLNWRAVGLIVGLAITATGMWMNLKNDVSNLQQRMETVSSQLDHQGAMIDRINAKLQPPQVVAGTR